MSWPMDGEQRFYATEPMASNDGRGTYFVSAVLDRAYCHGVVSEHRVQGASAASRAAAAAAAAANESDDPFYKAEAA